MCEEMEEASRVSVDAWRMDHGVSLFTRCTAYAKWEAY